MQKSERAHAAAPPFQIEPASLGFDLVLGASLKAVTSILFRCAKKRDTPLGVSLFGITVKGEEYDNVLFVMGRGWNLYKFEDTLYKDENTLHGKELEAYTRNRNLFYVCCSRPRKRLAILITVEINTQFEEYLQNIFGADNIVPYNEFMA